MRAALPTAPASATKSLDWTRAQASECRRCPLWAGATQVVFGEGRREALAILVGEQPDDREDILGRSFVGPAGRVLDAALERAGVPRGELYLTNAVKHFKNEPRGKRKLHKAPNAQEVEACRFWLDQELALVRAPIVVALGASALRGVGGPTFRGATISSLRGSARWRASSTISRRSRHERGGGEQRGRHPTLNKPSCLQRRRQS
jgi:uracil-DNA glycosylase family protein